MPAHRQSRIFLVGLGLLIAAIGGLFCYWLGKGFVKVLAVEKWPEVHCVILKSAVTEFKPVPNVAPRYRLDVDYMYEWNGQTLHSDRVRSRVRTTTDRAKALSWQEAHMTGSESVCYVNPEDPSFAILEKDSRAVVYTIWFPGLFVVAGLGMVVQAIRRPAA